ncbi:unnamed protein product [Anisakis simplex]|uniref:PMEI domain-containing protein n=1 Tax=Anisakis simplex TaxID=6269 RepID=A0A0M3JTK5_ANISI|nr:unnamed protein product [Anisakis simplex]
MDALLNPLVMAYLSVVITCAVAGIVIIVNGVLLCALEHGEITIEIARCEEKFVCAIKAAKFAAVLNLENSLSLPMAAVVTISEISGLSMDQVVGEYDKDSMERRAIIYSVIGNDRLTKDFIESCPKFLQGGYKDEALLLKDKL